MMITYHGLDGNTRYFGSITRHSGDPVFAMLACHESVWIVPETSYTL
jgi:hypothetical protein